MLVTNESRLSINNGRVIVLEALTLIGIETPRNSLLLPPYWQDYIFSLQDKSLRKSDELVC